MSATKIKIGGKEFQAKLSIEAIEGLEAMFENEGLMILLTKKQSIRAMKATIVQAVLSEDDSKGPQINAAIKQELEEGAGFSGLAEAALGLVKASGILGKKPLGNGDDQAA